MNKNEKSNIANVHYQKMTKEYSKQIQYSIDNSKWYVEKNYVACRSTIQPIYIDTTKNEYVSENTHVIVTCTTSDYAALKYGKNAKTCILNFASFSHPGGGFLHGAMAQEESLCHNSTLYNVLKGLENPIYTSNNEQIKNRGLYKTSIIYSPNIIFMTNNKISSFDVITCAAPNKNVAIKNGCIQAEIEKVMENRLDSILWVARKNDVKTLILGAFGCGVFGNDPAFVARTFYKLLKYKYKNVFNTIVFAIPDETSMNYKTFNSQFRNFNYKIK